MMANSTNVPDEAASGLDLFAAAWLEQWVTKGGTIMIEADGRMTIGYPEYWLTRDAEKPPEDFPESVKQSHRTFMDASYMGAMRQMADLLEAVPGGRDAVKRHVAAFPDHMAADGRMGAWR